MVGLESYELFISNNKAHLDTAEGQTDLEKKELFHLTSIRHVFLSAVRNLYLLISKLKPFSQEKH